MKTENILGCIFLPAIIFALSGCSIVSSVPYLGTYGMGAGAPEVNKDGKFSDTLYNRRHFEGRVNKDVADEKNNTTPNYDWQRAWRVSFEEISRSSENPEYKKKYIITKRREAGLPIWPFMTK